jgi:hypothetical protein
VINFDAQQHFASLCCNLNQVAYARHDFDKAENYFQVAYDLYNRNKKIFHDALKKHIYVLSLVI